MAWEDCRFEPKCSANDIVLSSSGDGVDWSAVSRVPIDDVGSGVDHFIPGLAVDPSTSGAGAHLALTYYFYPDAACTPETCELNIGFISSPDGGANWGSSTALAGRLPGVVDSTRRPRKIRWPASTARRPSAAPWDGSDGFRRSAA